MTLDVGLWTPDNKGGRIMPEVNEVYVCQRCGLEVQVLKPGHCIPEC